MKKILILTVTAGNAHNACALRMKNKLESLGGVEVKIVDIVKAYSTKLNSWIANQGYSLAVSKCRPLYNLFYEYFKKQDPKKRYSTAPQKTILSLLNGLMEEILSFKPDVIYSTHFYGAIAITNLRLVYDLPCKTIVSSLDYVNSPFWESCIGVDYFCIANEDFIDECIYEGFKKEQLLPFGLPVDERTLEKSSKKEMKAKLGLNENIFTIFIMFGGGLWSGGFNIFKSLIKTMKDKNIQIIMINGKDKKSFNRINNMKFDENIKVLNIGFTLDVPMYLSACDIAITKCGGASSTEMINKSVPMLINSKLPAQEKYNLEYLINKGVALSYKNKKQLRDNILSLMASENLASFEDKFKPIQKNALSDLANFIVSLPKADYSKIINLNIDCKKVKKIVFKELKIKSKTKK